MSDLAFSIFADPSNPLQPTPSGLDEHHAMTRFTILLLALCALILSVSVSAASPPSFCKCTCFTNSTIIPLSSNTAPTVDPPHLDVRAAGRTCADCNRDFCLQQRLPICHNAENEDVFTTCFQRDSRKDQIVVLTFIAGTLGLLGWAAVRKILEKRKGLNGGETQQGYIAVGQ